MEPDYVSYDIKELLEAQRSIDRESYPLRYFRICQELDVKLADTDKLKTFHKKQQFSVLVLVKSIVALLVVFFAWKLKIAFFEGHISWKGQNEYFVDQNPYAFYFFVIVHTGFLCFMAFMLFSNQAFDKYTER